MRKLLVIALVGLLVAPVFAAGAPEAVEAKKDEITFVVSGNPHRFFHFTTAGCGGDDNIVLANVYDNLLCLENDGSLSNSLAESYELSPDGTVYTFHIRPGVKFSNGMDLTLEDIKWSLDTGAAGPLGGALLINYKECKIIDEHTLQVVLTAPYAAFPYCVASRVGGIACKAYWEEVGDKGYMSAPIGTGPYVLSDYAANDHITLTANPLHWRGEPPTKTINIKLVTDINTMILGLQNKDYDVMGNPSVDIVKRFEKDPDILTDLADSTGRISLYLNSWSGPANDLYLRKAIQYAVDKEEINIAVNNGAAKLLDIDMCPMYTGYPHKGVHIVQKDVAKAKEFLAKSNYKGEPYKILAQVGTDYETVAKVLQAQLMEVGINCKVDAVDNTTVRSRDEVRDFDCYLCNNLSSLPDADAVAGMFKPTRFPEPVWYPRTMEIFNLSQKGCSVPADQREPIYTEICNIITDEAYIVPLYNGLTSIAYNADLEGVGAHCLNYYLFRYWHWK